MSLDTTLPAKDSKIFELVIRRDCEQQDIAITTNDNKKWCLLSHIGARYYCFVFGQQMRWQQLSHDEYLRYKNYYNYLEIKHRTTITAEIMTFPHPKRRLESGSEAITMSRKEREQLAELRNSGLSRFLETSKLLHEIEGD
jgi:hypothetical protein